MHNHKCMKCGREFDCLCFLAIDNGRACEPCSITVLKEFNTSAILPAVRRTTELDRFLINPFHVEIKVYNPFAWGEPSEKLYKLLETERNIFLPKFIIWPEQRYRGNYDWCVSKENRIVSDFASIWNGLNDPGHHYDSFVYYKGMSGPDMQLNWPGNPLRSIAEDERTRIYWERLKGLQKPEEKV